MPRKSAEGLSVVPAGVSCLPARPSPPPELSDAAALIWRRLVASRPVDYFDAAAQQLLATLCRAQAEADRLAAIAEGMDPIAYITELSKLSRLVDMHRARAAQAATRLRLTKQSQTDQKGAGRAAAAGGRLSGDAALDALRGSR